jgi:hypothetical protein
MECFELVITATGGLERISASDAPTIHLGCPLSQFVIIHGWHLLPRKRRYGRKGGASSRQNRAASAGEAGAYGECTIDLDPEEWNRRKAAKAGLAAVAERSATTNASARDRGTELMAARTREKTALGLMPSWDAYAWSHTQRRAWAGHTRILPSRGRRRAIVLFAMSRSAAPIRADTTARTRLSKRRRSPTARAAFGPDATSKWLSRVQPEPPRLVCAGNRGPYNLADE